MEIETLKKSKQNGMKKHFLLSLGLIAVVVLGAGGISQFVPHGPLNVIEGAIASMDSAMLKSEYHKLMETDFNNLEYHRGYIKAHLAVPKVRHTKNSTIVRDDKGVQDEYDGYIHSNSPAVCDIGLYGMGYFYSFGKRSGSGAWIF